MSMDARKHFSFKGGKGGRLDSVCHAHWRGTRHNSQLKKTLLSRTRPHSFVGCQTFLQLSTGIDPWLYSHMFQFYHLLSVSEVFIYMAMVNKHKNIETD